MPSPFPGMDPYLEMHWPDVHSTLVVASRRQLQEQLSGSGLVARVEERLVVEAADEYLRSIRGDVVIGERDERPFAGSSSSAVAVAEPLVLPAEPVTQRSIAITDASTNRVVTVIEYLSPSNKLPGDGREQYLRKQRECIDANINLVEIDLVRTGEHVIAYPYQRLPKSHQTTYIACAYRAALDKQWEIYRMPFGQRLPIIRIPLRRSDKDITLDVQKAVDQAYEEGAFDTINYDKPCHPPLSDEERAAAKLEPR